MTHFNRRFMLWKDPKYAYRNIPEYRRQRSEALLVSEAAAAAVEARWAARQNEKRKFANVAQNPIP